eukprot:8462191-Pyramimonas_sp.AAC.5
MLQLKNSTLPQFFVDEVQRGGGALCCRANCSDGPSTLPLSLLPHASQGMWAQGSVVLMWRNAAVEFYYQKLDAGRTHVAVDAPSLLERVNWLQEHDQEVRYFQAVGWKAAPALTVAAASPHQPHPNTHNSRRIKGGARIDGRSGITTSVPPKSHENCRMEAGTRIDGHGGIATSAPPELPDDVASQRRAAHRIVSFV